MLQSEEISRPEDSMIKYLETCFQINNELHGEIVNFGGESGRQVSA